VLTAKNVYLDYAATTPLDAAVLEAMLPYFNVVYGNPSSIYSYGREARRAVDDARRRVAMAIGAEAGEVFFTSGGSESDNWAVKGVMLREENQGKRFITSQIEHHAILHTAARLEKQGIDVVYLPVDEEGFVQYDALVNCLREKTALVSIMHANNEIGTVEHIAEYSQIAHQNGALFHTDAVQTFGSIPVDVNKLGVDLLSISGHKIYGPKGVGALYVRKGTLIDSFIDGGAQERGKRAGTENVPGIVGLGKAAETACGRLDVFEDKVTRYRDYFISRICSEIPCARINGSLSSRLPGNVSVTFEGIDGSTMLMKLDQKGVFASSGSACTAGSLDPSHVLTAIGRTEKEASQTVRFTIGLLTELDEIDYALELLREIITELK